MRSLDRRSFLSLGGLALLAGPARGAERWAEGRHYFRTADPGTSAQRPKVSEVFSYGCPGCDAFLPYMQDLEKKLPATVAVEYLPASWIAAENWPVFQRTYLTAQTLGVAGEAHEAMFAAVWRTGELAVIDAAKRRPKKPLPSVEDVARFYERQTGVSAAKFVQTAGSFAVDSAIRLTDARIHSSRAEYTPTLVINDRYRLDARSAGGPEQLVEAALFLLGKTAS
jgi:thiol:disulfide interchange protein DsbA